MIDAAPIICIGYYGLRQLKTPNQPEFFIRGGWANPVVEPEALDDITLYD
jgi:hypothetical protein